MKGQWEIMREEEKLKHEFSVGGCRGKTMRKFFVIPLKKKHIQ